MWAIDGLTLLILVVCVLLVVGRVQAELIALVLRLLTGTPRSEYASLSWRTPGFSTIGESLRIPLMRVLLVATVTMVFRSAVGLE